MSKFISSVLLLAACFIGMKWAWSELVSGYKENQLHSKLELKQVKSYYVGGIKLFDNTNTVYVKAYNRYYSLEECKQNVLEVFASSKYTYSRVELFCFNVNNYKDGWQLNK